MAKKTVSKVPSEVVTPPRKRSIDIQSYLQRWIPYWGHPGWLVAERWRAFVRNQPIAGICRDTLIANLKNMGWDIVPKRTEDAGNRNIQRTIDYYKELFFQIEGSFDTYLDLMGQDMLDLPFGAMCEVVRENDDPEGHILSLYHVDAATLFPTGDEAFPVQQRVPELPGAIVNFPKHAMARMMISPRPEIRRKGWGMAPPEKAYLAVEMLFRGDRYYANLLIDTPEAGILDLMDMDAETAEAWIEGWHTLFQGIDGFKVPILHSHEKAAQWIPLNRPPIDMMYDNVTAKYAQILCAAYGLRLSDIGLEQAQGEKTLAGVIRGERQSRRSGYSTVKVNFENHFDWLLPEPIKFIWIDVDEESKLMKSKSVVAYGSALSTLVSAKMITQQEARQEIVAQGLLEIEINLEELPEELAMQEEQMPAEEPAYPFGKPVQLEEEVPPTQGGRGGPTPKMTWRQEPGDAQLRPHEWESQELKKMMDQILRPHMLAITHNAESPRIRRLIKVATRAMVPVVSKTFEVITDDQIQDFWLPEMCAMDFDLPSEMEGLILRQGIKDIHDELENHLERDPWWRTASDIEKKQILEIFVLAYERGMETVALDIVRTLYEEGLRDAPNLLGISFNLVDKAVIKEIEAHAADLVTLVDQGTKTFIKRIITSGVRQGLASPKIAQALREGVAAETLLKWDESYMGPVEDLIRDGLIQMSESRSMSIVNTEINRAENAGAFGQFIHSGLSTKRWVHLGERGVTEKGNPCPCVVCAGNEDLGFVPLDFVFKTVFKKGGVDGKGGQHHPPAHPTVCHCTIFFDEKDLFSAVERGVWKIWTGK